MNTGTRSIEQLSHFQCGHCAKWWAVGDAPQRDVWYCPWCGVKQEMKEGTNVPRETEHE